MIGLLRDDECARCDQGTHTCHECTCGTGADCMPKADCEDKCTPKGPKYMCTWNATEPKCVEDAEGKLTHDECTDECKPAVYAKCNYEENKCDECTPGADDRDCIYLKSYCDTA